MCSRRVWAGRGEELTTGLESWWRKSENTAAALVTLTMRHDQEHELGELWDGLSGAWAACSTKSRRVRRLRKELGVAGYVRRVEGTFGKAGWHIHAHVLVFIEWPETAPNSRDLGTAPGRQAALEELADAMFSAWSDHLAKVGLPRPIRDSGGLDFKLLDLSNPAAAVAGYVTTGSTMRERSAANEMTDGLGGGKEAKRGNCTPWDLLADAMKGDQWARRRWLEWEQGSKGRLALTWTRSLRKWLGEQRSEEELATEVADERNVILALGTDEWRKICATHGGPARLLNIAEAAYATGCDRADSIGSALTDVLLTLVDWGIRPP